MIKNFWWIETIYQIFLTAFIIYFVNDLHSYQDDMSILFCQCSHFTYFLTDFTFYSVYKPVVIFSYQQDFFTSANSPTKYKTNEYIFKWYGSWIGKNLTFVVKYYQKLALVKVSKYPPKNWNFFTHLNRKTEKCNQLTIDFSYFVGNCLVEIWTVKRKIIHLNQWNSDNQWQNIK